MGRISILLGENCCLWWVAGSSDRFRAQEYFDKLGDKERARLQALLERLAEKGAIRNKELCRKETDYLYCLKGKQDRLVFFREGNDVMFVHGFRKKTTKDRRLRRELETAERIRTEY